MARRHQRRGESQIHRHRGHSMASMVTMMSCRPLYIGTCALAMIGRGLALVPWAVWRDDCLSNWRTAQCGYNAHTEAVL
eukprot:8143838-Prorocentrum_lima.AAC.1